MRVSWPKFFCRHARSVFLCVCLLLPPSVALALAPISAKDRLGNVAGHIRGRDAKEVRRALEAADSRGDVPVAPVDPSPAHAFSALPPLSPELLNRLSDLHATMVASLHEEFTTFGISTPESAGSISAVRNCSVQNLPFPDGVNIAMIPDWGNGRDLAFLAGRKVGDVNVVCPLPVRGNLIYWSGFPARLFCRFALFLDRNGKWDWGYFEDPLPIHASWNISKDSTAEAIGIPVLSEKAVMEVCEDKSITKIALDRAGLRTPRWVCFAPKDNVTGRQVQEAMDALAFAKPVLHGWVVKAAVSAGGEEVRLFGSGPGQKNESVAQALQLLRRGHKSLIEERVENLPLLDPRGVRMDFNIRVLTTRDEADKACVAKKLVRIAPYEEGGPVSVFQGAEWMDWNTFSDWMGWDAAQRQNWANELESFAVAMSDAADTQAKLRSRNPQTHGGLYGLDISLSQDGFAAIEINAGAPAGIDALAQMKQGEAKFDAILPILRHLAQKGMAHRQLLAQTKPLEKGQWQEVQPAANDLIQLSRLLVNQQQNEKALDFAQEAVDVDPANSNAWAVLGDVHFNQGDYAAAAAAYQRALSLDSTYWRNHEWLFHCYQYLRQWEKALGAALEIVKVVPEKPEGYVWEGVARYELGDLRRAQEKIVQGLSKVPLRLQQPDPSTSSIVLNAWRCLAKIALDEKRSEDALTVIHKILKANPAYADFLAERFKLPQSADGQTIAEQSP